ncbi:MAG: Trans-2,3-dihydro-3-hydroxyanthranilate isomerase [Candidatus Udaeobacter sp.]|nr:MAG: Trans-2,3-dihydro-3-hydroxyanthranilate isomerase [Candidatus Udaeobacter sp.]
MTGDKLTEFANVFCLLSSVQEFESAVKYRYYTCDVFTETRFGGNQLAVLPQAVGLSTQQMQEIAREFNFSETTFVLPGRAGHTRHVRIFTPAREIPFAGHPNVGTAFVLASAGEFGEIKSSLTVTFEEQSGLVSVTIQEIGGEVASCELTAPQALSFGKTLPVELVAAAIAIDSQEIVTKTHGPQVASVGLPFIMVELRDRSVLERARISMSGFEALAAEDVMPDVYLYTRGTDGFDIRARMFAPLSGVPEDPATGSANCALAGLLAHYSQDSNGSFSWRIAQGVEMGRPSTLIARAEKKDGVVQTTRIGGAAVLVSEGTIYLD